jgi:hypothetical protein
VPIIPALPGCGESADQLIEIYQPDATEVYRSLVGHGYACWQHLSTLIAAVAHAGLTALYMPSGPLVVRLCGDSYEFTTASEPERPQLTHQIPVPGVPPVEVPLEGTVPPEQEHPTWCVRAAIHCSGPYPASPPGSVVRVRAWIEQPATAPAVPIVMLEVIEEDRPFEYRLGVEQARQLVDQVRLLLALVR